MYWNAHVAKRQTINTRIDTVKTTYPQMAFLTVAISWMRWGYWHLMPLLDWWKKNKEKTFKIGTHKNRLLKTSSWTVMDIFSWQSILQNYLQIMLDYKSLLERSNLDIISDKSLVKGFKILRIKNIISHRID